MLPEYKRAQHGYRWPGTGAVQAKIASKSVSVLQAACQGTQTHLKKADTPCKVVFCRVILR